MSIENVVDFSQATTAAERVASGQRARTATSAETAVTARPLLREAAIDAKHPGAAETAALRRIAEATGHVVNPDDLLPLIAEVALESTGTDSAYVYLFNESRDYLVLRAATDKSLDASMFGALKVAVGEGITGWVARERKHVAIASEAWTDERFHFIKSLGEDRFQSILSVPLICHGDVIGVVNVLVLFDFFVLAALPEKVL